MDMHGVTTRSKSFWAVRKIKFGIFNCAALFHLHPHNISMAEKTKQVYDESKIKTLSSLEHIRLRTGMYIGRIGNGSNPDDGCYVLLKEVVDNAIDEYIMGHGKEVADQIVEGPRQRARFRPRHPAGQGRGLRFQDQYGREIQ